MKKGFTLIELLVVIAIIGILASIVLVSLGTARNKAKDSVVKAELAGLRSSAELFASSASNVYTGFCADTSTNGASNPALGQTSSIQCNDTATVWAACSKLIGDTGTDGNKYYCVDSNGIAKENDPGATDTCGATIWEATAAEITACP